MRARVDVVMPLTNADSRRRAMPACVTAIALATSLALAAQQDGGRDSERPKRDQEGKRPRVTLRAQPPIAVAPARVVLTAELTGGADDFEDYYCPSIQWDWGDDTASESTSDCEPYEAGVTQIKRRYTVQHQFRRGGTFKVYFNIKRNDKTVGFASATVQIHPGARPTYD